MLDGRSGQGNRVLTVTRERTINLSGMLPQDLRTERADDAGAQSKHITARSQCETAQQPVEVVMRHIAFAAIPVHTM